MYEMGLLPAIVPLGHEMGLLPATISLGHEMGLLTIAGKKPISYVMLPNSWIETKEIARAYDKCGQ